jgi:hypothetical protein
MEIDFPISSFVIPNSSSVPNSTGNREYPNPLYAYLESFCVLYLQKISLIARAIT